MSELAKQQYFSPYRVTLMHAGLGDRTAAFAWLERAFEKRDARLIWLKVAPVLDDLRADLRFQDLLRRVG